MIDVQFSDFIGDPWATIKDIYVSLGRELSPDTDARAGIVTETPLVATRHERFF